MARHLVTHKIDTADLRIGMYVTALEVPWSLTEFPLEGVLVKSAQDIVRLSKYGRRVEIDQSKSQSRDSLQNIAKAVSSISDKASPAKNTIPSTSILWRKFCTESYKVKVPIAKQLKKADELLDRVHNVFDDLKKDLSNNQVRSIDNVREVSHRIVSTLLDNPDALLWLTKVKIQHGKVYDHIVRSAIWATLMGRSMGLKSASLNTLVEALLLSGIGKAYLSQQVWKDHNPADMKPEFASAVHKTIEKLSHCQVDPRVLMIIGNMNERYDGSGYSSQKSLDKIPYLAQMAGLVETFDLILHPMCSKKRRAFGQALSRLYCFRDSLFNGALIEEFIRATGLYPSGTVVVLSNGYRGVVVEQTKDRRIRATVALTHDAQDYRLMNYKIAGLGAGEYANVIIKEEANLHQINDDDMQKINLLIKQYQQGKLAKIFSSSKRLFSS